MSYAIQRPKKITSESLASELQSAVDLVGVSLNPYMEQVYLAIMGNLGVGTNLNMEFKTIEVTVNASGIPTTTVAFKSNLKSKIVGSVVINVYLATPLSQPFCSLSENNGLIQITHVTGLSPNTKYQLILLTIGT